MYVCICMNLWVVVVLELDDSHPNNNSGTRPRTLRLSKDPSYILKILAILHSSQQNLCLEALTVHGSEVHLFVALAFPPTCTINVAHMS